MTSINDIDANLVKISGYIRDCAKRGAELICLPENFAFMGSTPEETDAIKQPLDGSIMNQYAQLAIENKVFLSLGGF